MVRIKVDSKGNGGAKCIRKFVSMVAVLTLCLAVVTPILSNAAYATTFEAGCGPAVFQASNVISADNVISSTNEVEYDYVSHVFTVADVIFFSYVDGTMLALYDSSGTLIWNNGGNPLNKGGHAHVAVSQGVYTACGSEKFAVLTGDPITRYVVGYYAMDQNGYGASTEFYTWVPRIYGHCSFIVFAYQDNTQVTVEETDTGVGIATFDLNRGEHWRIETLDSKWLHITANNPISALTCYDQGYFVPSASGRWSGTEFYTYVSNIQSWPEDLTVIAYNDGTSVTIKDSDTGTVVWSGTLDEGQAHVESYPSGADKFFTITSSKPVTVSVQPWVSMTSNYHQGTYVADSTGTMLGTDLIGSTLNGGYLYILAYRDDTNVVVYNSRTGEFVASYTLDAGDYIEANPGNGLWRIMSNYHVSAYSGWGQWNAEFAPVEFREVTAVNVDISTDKSRYAPGELITISAKVTDANGNPLYPLQKSNFKVSLDENGVNIEEFKIVSATDYKIKIKAPLAIGGYSIGVKVITAVGEGMGNQQITVVVKNRKALVIGITEYQSKTVPKLDPTFPHQVAQYLEKLGFEVYECIDWDNNDGDVITYDEVSNVIKNFKDGLSPNDVAIVYISTHGSQFWRFWDTVYFMNYGDKEYPEDPWWPEDWWPFSRKTVRDQLEVVGTNLDFLWLATCYSWAFDDEIKNLGAGGIIFFGNDGIGWQGEQDSVVFYNSIVGGCYECYVKKDKIPEIRNNPGIRSVEILEETEDVALVKICSKQQRYVEDIIDDVNIPNGKDINGDEIVLNLRIDDQYPGKMDLLGPLLTPKSPNVYVSEPEGTTQIPNETFANVNYTIWDSDDDGLNDAATVSWDANTVLPEEDVIVIADVYNNSNRLVKSYIYGPYTIYGDSEEDSRFDFYSTSMNVYSITLKLYDSSMNPADIAFITDLSLNAGTGSLSGDEEFTDVWFTTSDSNGDGVADTIRVSWNADTTLQEENISVLATVRHNVFKYGPYIIYASQLNEGEIEFYAEDIGTYEFSLYLVDSNSELEDFEYLEVPLETTSFTDSYADYGVDIDGDGKYDQLAIDVGINVAAAANYILQGSLYDEGGTLILTTTNFAYLTEGEKIVQLSFDGQTIYKNGINGPYELRYLRLYEDGAFIGRRDRPYTTSLYTYMEFQPPPVVLDWNLTTPLEALLDETFDITVGITNPSDRALANLQAVLTLSSEFDTTEPLIVNVGELEPNQTKEIDWTLNAIIPGYGEITVNVTSPDIQNISVTRGIIVTHFPLSVETDKKTYLQGDNVIITTTTTNENPEVSYIDLLVNITVEGPSVQEPYSMPIDFISSLETRNFALTWDSTGKPFGDYVIVTRILENTTVLNEASTSFALTTVDTIPPTTLLTIGEPKYLDLMGNIYVSFATPFTLTAEDNPGGTGVASTFYRIYNSSYDTGWLEYSVPFYLTGLTDGQYSIDYYSTDNAGNVEPTNTATIILDNTPPTTTLTIGEPKYIESINTYVASATSFTLTATDNTGSGVALIVYKIYNSTYDSGWITYTGNFSLPTWLDNGPYLIAYNSTDNLGNVEAENMAIVILRNPLVDTWMTDSDFNEIEGFRVVFTPYRNTGLYKLTATNPGQFYLNILVNNTWPEPLNITIVYLIDANFTFKGAKPIHVYADLERTIDITANCTFSDNTITVYNVAPNTIIYVTIHLDYALKGTTWTEEDVEAWYSEHAFNATVHPITSEVIIIDPELQIPPIPSYLIFLIVIVPMIILCLGLILLLKYAPLIAARCKED